MKHFYNNQINLLFSFQSIDLTVLLFLSLKGYSSLSLVKIINKLNHRTGCWRRRLTRTPFPHGQRVGSPAYLKEWPHLKLPRPIFWSFPIPVGSIPNKCLKNIGSPFSHQTIVGNVLTDKDPKLKWLKMCIGWLPSLILCLCNRALECQDNELVVLLTSAFCGC